MIYTERIITVKNDTATINSPVILYRGDRNVEIRFTIKDSMFKYDSKRSNIINRADAYYGQLAILMPNENALFTDITPTIDGAIIFTITSDMIDEFEENGLYSFHIRLYNENQESRVTIPAVIDGIEIKEPIVTEDPAEVSDAIGAAMVGYSVLMVTENDMDAFYDEIYNKTEWKTGDRITAAKLNKVEQALFEISKDKTDVDIDLAPYALKEDIPTKTSQLTNDSGYLVSNTILRIEVVDSLPEIEEEGVLYICKDNNGGDPETPTTKTNLYYQSTPKTYISETSGYTYTFGTDNTFVINTTVAALTKDIDKKSNTFGIQLESGKTYKFKASYISGSSTRKIMLFFENNADSTIYAELELENNMDSEVEFTVASSASVTGILTFYGYNGASYSELKYSIEIFEV